MYLNTANSGEWLKCDFYVRLTLVISWFIVSSWLKVSKLAVFSRSVEVSKLQISFSREDYLKKGKTVCRYLLQVQ